MRFSFKAPSGSGFGLRGQRALAAALAIGGMAVSAVARGDELERRREALFPPGCDGIVLVPEAAPRQPCEQLAQVSSETVPPASKSAARPNDSPKPRAKHFGTAVLELAILEAGPWAFDRYVLNEDFSRISIATVRQNWRTGFQFDRDHFDVNQFAHPYHGSLFFEAGRSNGYSYWSSGLFALSGSLVWECCMENDAPSINDVVNTTLGGMTRGEISHRLSVMILDNEATGVNRFFRELAAALVNPVGAVSRLAHGDMTRDYPNPDERFPGSFAVSMDLGYRRIGGDASHPNQGTLSFSALYGDPFAGDIQKPFDSFWVGADLNAPGGAAISRLEERGILKGWELTDPDAPVRHIFGFTQEYEYLNNESQVVGAQFFSAGLLSKYRIGKLAAATEADVVAVPLAAVKTIDFESPTTGRNYDYAPGGGARVAGRIYYGAREIAAAGYGVVWVRTVDGVSRENTLQFFRAAARVPIAGPVGIGGGYTWYSRKTTYPGFFEARKTQNEWRVFVNVAFGHSRRDNAR